LILSTVGFSISVFISSIGFTIKGITSHFFIISFIGYMLSLLGITHPTKLSTQGTSTTSF
jgi:hypothetical protein